MPSPTSQLINVLLSKLAKILRNTVWIRGVYPLGEYLRELCRVCTTDLLLMGNLGDKAAGANGLPLQLNSILKEFSPPGGLQI